MSDRNTGHPPDCPDGETLVAHLRDEVTPEERTWVDEHLAACHACRAEVERYRRLVGVLTELCDDTTDRDLTGKVLARLPKETSFSDRRFLLTAAAAAILVIGIAVASLLNRASEDVTPEATATAATHVEVGRALDWLARTQEPDGSWAPRKWEGQPIYRVGLTGLALLAFLGSDDDVTAGRYAETVERATGFLLAEQKKNGRFGPFFSAAPYNHGIATVALLHRYARRRDEKLKRPIEQALIFIGRHQGARGGWGYLSPEQRTNTSVTAWQLTAVLLADALGWPQARDAADKGLAWIANTLDAEGRAGYSRPGDFRYGPDVPTAIAAFCLSVGAAEDRRAPSAVKVTDALLRLASASTETEKVNFYRSYFLTHALGVARERGHADPSKLAVLSLRLKGDLVDRQVAEGLHAGSWDPTDRWSRAGGRVYATAMAALSLEADRRAQQIASRSAPRPR